MSVLTDARDEMVYDLKRLEPGSVALLNHAQAIKTMTEADVAERKFEFEVEKEETRKVERATDLAAAEIDRKLRWIEVGIKALDVIANPLASLRKTAMINKVKIERDIMGYHFEETGVVGSNTFNNALKDKYD